MAPEDDSIADWLNQSSGDPEAVADRYDDWAQSYDVDLIAWDYRAPTVVVDAVLTRTPDVAEVLDVGCGTGLVGRTFRHHGFTGRLTGLDLSQASLDLAAESGAYAELTQADLQQRLPLDDDAADATVCVGVMTYLPEVEPFWRELARVTRPGGLVVVTQRDDLWETRDCQAIVDRLAADGLWTPVDVTGPAPYLPEGYGGGPAVACFYLTAQVELRSRHSPSDTTSTTPSTTVIAVWSSIAYAGPPIRAIHSSASAIELPGIPSGARCGKIEKSTTPSARSSGAASHSTNSGPIRGVITMLPALSPTQTVSSPSDGSRSASPDSRIQWARYVASPPATSSTSASRTHGSHRSAPTLGSAVSSSSPTDFQPRPTIGSVSRPLAKRSADSGPHIGWPYWAVGMASAVHSSIGRPSSSSSAAWMVGFVTPADVSSSFKETSRGGCAAY